jgi:hypothetical protein
LTAYICGMARALRIALVAALQVSLDGFIEGPNEELDPPHLNRPGQPCHIPKP